MKTKIIAGREVGVQSSCTEADGGMYANILIRQDDMVPMYGSFTCRGEDITFYPSDGHRVAGHMTVAGWRKFVVENLSAIKILVISTL